MKNNEQLDERQVLIGQKAVGFAGIFLMICMGVATVYNIATKDSPGWEFWALIGACFVIIISKRILGDIEQPKSITGKLLPTDSSKKSKFIRIKDYCMQSVVFGLACAVMDILLMLFGEHDFVDAQLTEIIFPSLSKFPTVIITALLAFASAFIISFISEFIIGEFYKIKKYNKMLSTFEDDE